MSHAVNPRWLWGGLLHMLRGCSRRESVEGPYGMLFCSRCGMRL